MLIVPQVFIFDLYSRFHELTVGLSIPRPNLEGDHRTQTRNSSLNIRNYLPSNYHFLTLSFYQFI